MNDAVSEGGRSVWQNIPGPAAVNIRPNIQAGRFQKCLNTFDGALSGFQCLVENEGNLEVLIDFVNELRSSRDSLKIRPHFATTFSTTPYIFEQAMRDHG